MRDGLGTSQMIVLVAREGFLKAHPKALDDFFDDLVRGTHWMLNPANRQKAIQFVAKESHQPASMFEPYYLTRKDEYRDPNDIPDLAALQHNIDTEVKFGFLKHSFDVKKYADLSFVERAARHYATEEKTASAK
jgi:ABC-type nitrate/sulfonate/bicarbonate transport system substrate-binding protein